MKSFWRRRRPFLKGQKMLIGLFASGMRGERDSWEGCLPERSLLPLSNLISCQTTRLILFVKVFDNMMRE